MGNMFKKLTVATLVLTSSIGLVSGTASAAPLQFTYKWSDGPAVAVKNMSVSKYQYETYVPTVDVKLPITNVSRQVTLQFSSKGKWYEEDVQMTANGTVSLTVNPLYDDSTWLRGTWDYRLVVAPMTGQPNFKNIRFKIKFSSGSSTSSGGSSSGGGSSGGSGGSSGGGGGSYVGWNLENLQDYLGFNPSTADCSGSGRSVFWSSNWWVVGQYGSTLIVSKARGYCS
jgi:uncharacterized membrane protein YgcG